MFRQLTKFQKNYPLYSRPIGSQPKADGRLVFFVEVTSEGEVLDGYGVNCPLFLTYEELDRVFAKRPLAQFAAEG